MAFKPIVNNPDEFDVKQKIADSLMDINEEKYAFLIGRNKEYNIYHFFIKPKTLCIYQVKDYKTKKGAYDIKKITDRVKVENGYIYRFDKIKKKWYKMLPDTKGANIIKMRKYFFKKSFDKALLNSKKRISYLLIQWNLQGENNEENN